MLRKFSLVCVLLLHVCALDAHASGSAVLSTTRELAKQGLEAYDAGRYDEAVEKLSKAYQVVRLPTLAVATARALAKTGKLVAASELYLEATRIPVEDGWQAAQHDAKRDAVKERAEIAPRIARLTLKVKGPSIEQVAIVIDGAAIPSAIADAPQLLNPGEHRIEGTFQGKVVTRTATVNEGEHGELTLSFVSGEARGPLAAEATPSSENSATAGGSGQRAVAETKTGRTQKILGVGALALGGAGLVIGAGSGLWAYSKRSALLDSESCAGDRVSCKSDRDDEVASYNRLRQIYPVGLIVGGVFAATGVTLLLTSPTSEKKTMAGIWVQPGGAGIWGGF